ncbi:hypothetical protein [Nodosilinea nodulosa]|uniref:hypothetical protein n=1 Tax=Nodosilinea nodulosa TaxID=416001 RepID=UPI00035D09E2|nr:hypothetical protein [Nodosilinea nodulosa]
MGSGERAGRWPSTRNNNDIDGESSALLAVEVTGNREVIGDGVLVVENVEEGATFAGVVTLGPELWINALFASQNQHRSPVVFHRLQGFEGDRLVYLSCPGVGDGEALGAVIRAFDRAKGRVADHPVYFSLGLVGGGIILGELPVASAPEFGDAIAVDLIGDHPLWICPNQQRPVPGCGFIN